MSMGEGWLWDAVSAERVLYVSRGRLEQLWDLSFPCWVEGPVAVNEQLKET